MRFLLLLFSLTLPVVLPVHAQEGEAGLAPLPRNRSLVVRPPGAEVRELRPGIRAEVLAARAFAADPNTATLGPFVAAVNANPGQRIRSAESIRILREGFRRFLELPAFDRLGLFGLYATSGHFRREDHDRIAALLVDPKLAADIRLALLEQYGMFLKNLPLAVRPADAARVIRDSLALPDMRELFTVNVGFARLQELGQVSREDVARLFAAARAATPKEFATYVNVGQVVAEKLLSHRHLWPEAPVVEAAMQSARANQRVGSRAPFVQVLVENGTFTPDDLRIVLGALSYSPVKLSERALGHIAAKAAADPEFRISLRADVESLLNPENASTSRARTAALLNDILERSFAISLAGCVVSFEKFGEREKWRKSFREMYVPE